MPARSVSIANRHPKLIVNRRLIARAVEVLDTSAGDFIAGCPAGELSLVFLTDDALAGIHGDFLDDPTTTDVITFEGDETSGVAGEVCVSVDTARSYSEEHRIDFSAELTLYVVHGWLHLAGYDDLAPAKKRIMRRAEAKAMQLLEQHECTAGFSLR